MSLPLLRKRLLLLPRMAARPARRAYESNPPQGHVGPMETAVGLFVIFTACLAPSFYIMANLESYRKRE